jgi:hypothetical protein
MEWLTTLLSGPLGAIVGGAGAVVQRYLDYKDASNRRAHELAMRDKDREQLAMELAAKSEIARVDADTQVAVRELDAMTSAIQADRATYGDSLTGRIVDLARGLIRPVITLASGVLMGIVAWRAFRDGPALTAETQAFIIRSVLFTASGAIGFWFGMRPVSGGRR